MNYKKLREKYPQFVYESYKWKIVENDLEIQFKFQVNEYIFSPKLIYKNIDKNNIKNKEKYIDNLVFSIGIIESLSYWKAFCSPKIIIKAGYLDKYQINWWKKLLINGMGEYFYENNIDFTKKNFIKFKSDYKKNSKVQPCYVGGDEKLIPVGGGKDSSVTLDLISGYFRKTTGFVINPTKAQIETLKIANIKMMEVYREMDPLLFSLNRDGFLNGHTPFSALLSFTSILAGVVGNFKQVVFSNEQSSDEGNTKYLGKNINHQYSKSFEFENDFRKYNEKYLSNINYFSFLRPVYDIQIAKIFSKLKKYHKVIRSCNVGQKTDTWCGRCPKCLSTFILLYPFMKESTLKIFGNNLLNDKSLKPILKNLLEEKNVKPFECVGTKHELKVALGIEKDENLLNFWGENNLPADFKLLLYLNLILKNNKILILGYGREGKSTEKILKRYLPDQKFDIADQKLNKNYLKHLEGYDVVFKSPGIPNNLSEIKHAKKSGVEFTSQTKIFLKLFRKTTVGITGTKGKSTTASLTFFILKESGFDVELVGNIGKPVFDYLKGSKEDKIFVSELSSHQLSDIDISPKYAVFLNIFPEHLDYYESFEDYKKAKENIFRFQKKGDIYISESDISKFRLQRIKTNLLGKHNIKNIKTAFLVAKEFGLKNRQIITAIKNFKPLTDRLEVVRKIEGVTFINDGLATIPQATIAAVDSFKENLTLILGGFDRGVSFSEFGKEIKKRKNVKNIILIGQTAEKIEKSIGKTKIDVYNLGFSSMKKIVYKAFKIAKRGEIVLLSPASTSFDMFKDYRDRDEKFKKAVASL